jgi:hypothetical protein
MEAVNPNRTGLVFAALIGGWHAAWVLAVAFGWAQDLLDFVFWMHFLKPVYTVGQFNIWIALVLIAVTAVTGYVMGYVLAALWNWIQRTSTPRSEF